MPKQEADQADHRGPRCPHQLLPGRYQGVGHGVKAVSVVAPLLKELPDIIVGTPGCPSQHLKEGNLNLTTSLAMLINDEADLIFSFCFESDL